MTTVAIAVAVLAALLYGLWHLALSRSAVALLDGADALIGGTDGTRVAVAEAAFGPDPAQRLEMIVPAATGTAPRPVLVFIHGGGWNSGTPGNYHFVGRQFARAGYVVVLPGYRLVPGGVFPAMLQDGAAALAWVRAEVARHGGDPQRVFVMGHSAGAYNAAMLALDPQWLHRAGVPDGFVKGVIGLAGPYDFFPFTTDSARRAFGAVTRPETTQPVSFARVGAPPLLLLHGDADSTVKPRNSLALAKAMTAAGAPTQAVLLQGMSHEGIVMKLAEPFSRDGRVRDAVLAFLAEHGGVPSAPVQAREQ